MTFSRPRMANLATRLRRFVSPQGLTRGLTPFSSYFLSVTYLFQFQSESFSQGPSCLQKPISVEFNPIQHIGGGMGEQGFFVLSAKIQKLL